MSSFFAAMWHVLVELAPWLLLGALLSGLLYVVLPPDFVQRHLRGRTGVLKAVALGVPLPLCSCGVIPAALGLRKQGATRGAAVGFLISTPQTGVDSILVSASFLGWPFALFKVAAAALLGVVGGFWADAATPASEAATPLRAPGVAGDEVSQRRGRIQLLTHALDVLRTIWVWVVLGVVASAAIETLLPPTWLQSLSSLDPWIPVLAALTISVPLYVCATASVPIAAALVSAGFPAGAALVFLIAGPATNVATIGAVSAALGRRTAVIYLATVIVGSVALALTFDFVLPPAMAVPVHDHGAMSVWAQLTAAALLGLLLWFALDDLRAAMRRHRSRMGAKAETTLEVGVEGMTCMGCVRRLDAALRSDAAVHAADVTLDPPRARVAGTLDEARLRALIEGAGFRCTSRP